MFDTAAGTCGCFYLASNLTALRCVAQKGLCLHTSDGFQGAGLTGNSYITGADCFKQLRGIFLPPAQQPPVLDEQTGQSGLASNTCMRYFLYGALLLIIVITPPNPV